MFDQFQIEIMPTNSCTSLNILSSKETKLQRSLSPNLLLSPTHSVLQLTKPFCPLVVFTMYKNHK